MTDGLDNTGNRAVQSERQRVIIVEAGDRQAPGQWHPTSAEDRMEYVEGRLRNVMSPLEFYYHELGDSDIIQGIFYHWRDATINLKYDMHPNRGAVVSVMVHSDRNRTGEDLLDILKTICPKCRFE